MYSAASIAAARYDAIAFDNYWTLEQMGAIGPCGVWRDKQRVQLFTSIHDPKIDEVHVDWTKNVYCTYDWGENHGRWTSLYTKKESRSIKTAIFIES